jgi:transcriptional regulator with XRE-family HTH domain
LNYALIGRRIVEIRKKKGFSQEVLAEMAGVSPSHIGHIERADTKLSVAALVSIANALDVAPDKILADVADNAEKHLAGDFAELIEDCNTSEVYQMLQIAKSAKQAMRDKGMT